MENLLPKVLVVSTNAWVDGSGVNTLINLFENWDVNRVAQIYTKSEFPNTKVCNRFFQISEQKVLKSLLNFRIKTGQEVSNKQVISNEASKNLEIEKKRYKKSGRFFLLSFMREIVWLLGRWKTKALLDYIKSVDPDILFLPVYPTIYMGLIQLYVVKKTHKPYVCYISDDNYTYKSITKSPLHIIHRFFLRKTVKKLILNCNQLMVIAPKQKEEYDKIFCKNSIIITKGIDTEQRYDRFNVHKPIRMLYTGKTIIGREKTLFLIANSLNRINSSELKIVFDIYTSDTVKKYTDFMKIPGVKIHPPVSLAEVQELQNEADILVFVEALDKRHRNIARLSFSTKITDYLKSGKCIFAVGSKNIAPIDYFLKENSAIVSTSAEQVFVNLEKMVQNQNLIVQYGINAYECGKRNHNKELMRNRFKNILVEVGNEIVTDKQ